MKSIAMYFGCQLATTLTRSSFHADEDFTALKQARQAALSKGA